jgi:hypothetical protein
MSLPSWRRISLAKVLVFCYDLDTNSPTIVGLLVMSLDSESNGMSWVEGDQIDLRIVVDQIHMYLGLACS